MKARDTFQEAEILLDANRHNGMANRAYYALYQGLYPIFKQRKPALLDKATGQISHNAVVVHCGAFIGPEHARTVKRAFTLRVKADYGRENIIALETDGLLPAVDAALIRIESLVL